MTCIVESRISQMFPARVQSIPEISSREVLPGELTEKPQCVQILSYFWIVRDIIICSCQLLFSYLEPACLFPLQTYFCFQETFFFLYKVWGLISIVSRGTVVAVCFCVSQGHLRMSQAHSHPAALQKCSGFPGWQMYQYCCCYKKVANSMEPALLKKLLFQVLFYRKKIVASSQKQLTAE